MIARTSVVIISAIRLLLLALLLEAEPAALQLSRSAPAQIRISTRVRLSHHDTVPQDGARGFRRTWRRRTSKSCYQRHNRCQTPVGRSTSMNTRETNKAHAIFARANLEILS